MLKIVLINGQSMSPTLRSGERVLVWTPFCRWIVRRGRIVTLSHFHLHLPPEKRSLPNYQTAMAVAKREHSALSVKRIVGLPGDTVRIPLAHLSQHSLTTIDPQAIRNGDEFRWHIPEGHVFVRGDSVYSCDSVTWGPIPFAELQQIVLCRFPSFRRIP